ncbi:flagellar motor switch protein FliN/FliY [Novosphingobium sp. PhB57]|uniref:flagellar motor switch protein FliN n=1 Tax=unclassified Novosphingobium TaxID=2644732 RepID=UPI0010E0A25E|nr:MULTISPECIES: flagellar motor switch protein FliN [unclassified Novosphingobium]TCU56182.1 flagellar motor switch protein FliN/FliY [Novosphingobium sp. PhB57]TDW65321.1 flagellar motor switch protein FliN/FliY [Novosphingobium sp. PhB55]
MSDELEPRQLAPAHLSDENPNGEASEDAAAAWSPRPTTPPTPDDLQAVFDVPVKVQAVLGRSRMDIGDLLRLKPGMVVELDRRVGEPVDIFVNNRLIARGEVVLIDSTLGITLTEIVRQEA